MGIWPAIETAGPARLSAIRSELQGIADNRPSDRTRDLAAVAAVAYNLSNTSWKATTDLADLLQSDAPSNARLALLAAEVALAAGDLIWLLDNQTQLESHVESLAAQPLLRLRLRLVVADATGQWAGLLHDARVTKSDGGLEGAALTLARSARYLALREQFVEADAHWEEAVGKAVLVQRWKDAEAWTMSRRAYRVYWNRRSVNDLLSVQNAIRAQGQSTRLAPGFDDAYQQALQRLHDKSGGGAPEAVRLASRTVRDAVVRGDWADEEQARVLLGDARTAVGDLDEAAHEYALAAKSTGSV